MCIDETKCRQITNFCPIELSFFFFFKYASQISHLPPIRNPNESMILWPWQNNSFFSLPLFCTSCFSLCQKLSGLISLKCKIKTWVSKQRFPSLFSKYKHLTLTKKKHSSRKETPRSLKKKKKTYSKEIFWARKGKKFSYKIFIRALFTKREKKSNN